MSLPNSLVAVLCYASYGKQTSVCFTMDTSGNEQLLWAVVTMSICWSQRMFTLTEKYVKYHQCSFRFQGLQSGLPERLFFKPNFAMLVYFRTLWLRKICLASWCLSGLQSKS